MKTSEETNEIIKALIKSQQEFQKVNKETKNPFANSKYANLDNVLEMTLPILNNNGIFATHNVLTDEKIAENDKLGKIGIQLLLIHQSGQRIEYDTVWFLLEKGSKMNLAQSQGSIITYGRRYTLVSALNIMTNDDVDGTTPDDKQTQSQQYQRQNYDNSKAQAIGELKKVLIHLKKLDEANKFIIQSEKAESLQDVDPEKIMEYYQKIIKKIKSSENKVNWGQQ